MAVKRISMMHNNGKLCPTFIFMMVFQNRTTFLLNMNMPQNEKNKNSNKRFTASTLENKPKQTLKIRCRVGHSQITFMEDHRIGSSFLVVFESKFKTQIHNAKKNSFCSSLFCCLPILFVYFSKINLTRGPGLKATFNHFLNKTESFLVT